MLEHWQSAKNKGWLSKWGKEGKAVLHFTQTLSSSVANFLPEDTQKNPLHSQRLDRVPGVPTPSNHMT